MKYKTIFMLNNGSFHEVWSIDGYLLSDMISNIRKDYLSTDRCTDHIEPDEKSHIDDVKFLPCIEYLLINQFPFTYKRYTHNDIPNGTNTSTITLKDE